MRLKHHDGLFRVFVQSESKPKVWYLVDLEAIYGNGWCNCDDFQFRRKPVLSDNNRTGSDTRCKHIEFAREHIGLELLDMVMKKRRNKNQDEF